MTVVFEDGVTVRVSVAAGPPVTNPPGTGPVVKAVTEAEEACIVDRYRRSGQWITGPLPSDLEPAAPEPVVKTAKENNTMPTRKLPASVERRLDEMDAAILGAVTKALEGASDDGRVPCPACSSTGQLGALKCPTCAGVKRLPRDHVSRGRVVKSVLDGLSPNERARVLGGAPDHGRRLPPVDEKSRRRPRRKSTGSMTVPGLSARRRPPSRPCTQRRAFRQGRRQAGPMRSRRQPSMV